MNFAALNGFLSNWIFLGLIVAIPTFGALKRVNVYESFVEGARGSIDITVRIIPYLVAMIVAIGMLRASGAFQLLGHALGPVLKEIGMPPDLLPMALIRPFSGSAANGMLAEIAHTHGGNSYIAKVAATMMGSTETTFYVVAIYFGAVNVRRTRHAVPAGLFADLVGIASALVVCHYAFLN
jgi:spore maturation protein B